MVEILPFCDQNSSRNISGVKNSVDVTIKIVVLPSHIKKQFSVERSPTAMHSSKQVRIEVIVVRDVDEEVLGEVVG